MSEYLPHTIAADGIYALPGYPVTRLDVGLPTYRRSAAGGLSSFMPLRRAMLAQRPART